MEKQAEVLVYRHSIAKYKQGRVSLNEANDLKPEGIELMRTNAQAAVQFCLGHESVDIISSAFGRNLHSAKIIAEALTANGIHSQIQISNLLGEVENFEWRLFEPLMSGGEVEYAGKVFFINKAESNPLGLAYPEYFIQDGIGMIATEHVTKWPNDYVSRIQSFETWEQCRARMEWFVKALRARMRVENTKNVIVVTHDALLNQLAMTATGEKKKSIEPAGFLRLRFPFDAEITTVIMRGFPPRDIAW